MTKDTEEYLRSVIQEFLLSGCAPHMTPAQKVEFTNLLIRAYEDEESCPTCEREAED